ncbi:MAG: hypothetical protein WDN04_23310 [Rhodospirillales bacterium]
MTHSGAIAEHLPMLRRFARALTGSQEGGDAYVLATLETMAETGQRFEGEDARRGLFGALLRVWQAMPMNRRAANDPHPEGIARAADRSLERLTPQSRVAFLLHALEGFFARGYRRDHGYRPGGSGLAAGKRRARNRGHDQHQRADHRG